MKMKWTRIERGIFSLSYPDDPSRIGGFWGRYKAFGQNKWTGPHSSIAKARAALRTALETYAQQKLQGITIAPTRDTVECIIGEYLKEQKDTVDEYRAQVRYADFWKATFKRRPILSVQPKEVRRARARLKARQVAGEPLSDSTANHYCKWFRTMMLRMVKPKAWVIEFWSEVPLPKPTPKRERGTYAEDQEERLYAHMRPFDILFCRLAYLLGIRGGQMVTLRWEYVLWSSDALALPKFKRHRPRTIPLSVEARVILMYFCQQQGTPEQGWAFPEMEGNQHALRPAKTDVHMDYHNWYNRHFLDAIGQAGLTGMGLDFHTLRHTWATRLGDKVPTRVLQVLGGWSDLKLVERYAKNPVLGAMREAMEHASDFGSEGAKRVLTGILATPRPYLKVVEK